MSSPGTYRVSDGSKVDFVTAVEAWSEAAHAVLIQTASRYNGRITYQELADEVQDRAGIKTRTLLMNWIGKVLEAVAAECARRGDEYLTSLCVRQDGTVGEGYATAMERHGDGRPDDPEMHAAHARLRCYQKYASDLPASGGSPELTPQEAARRQKKKLKIADRTSCPVHHTTLPLTGICDQCE